MSVTVDAINRYLHHLAAHDLPDHDLYRLKAVAFGHMAADFDHEGSAEIGDECRATAAESWTRAKVGEDVYCDLTDTIDPGDNEQ